MIGVLLRILFKILFVHIAAQNREFVNGPGLVSTAIGNLSRHYSIPELLFEKLVLKQNSRETKRRADETKAMGRGKSFIRGAITEWNTVLVVLEPSKGHIKLQSKECSISEHVQSLCGATEKGAAQSWSSLDVYETDIY